MREPLCLKAKLKINEPKNSPCARKRKPNVAMNDLSATVTAAAPRLAGCGLVPAPIPCVLASLLLASFAVSVFILVVVHNALFLGSVLLISALVLSFLLWNAASFRRNTAVLCFVDRFPASNLLTAKDGELVKITGSASCADISLESSYEKVGSCVYTSTLLYEFGSPHSKPSNVIGKCFQWNLVYLERFTTDFYITDMRSGARALVKAGYSSKVIPLVYENTLVKTTSKSRELSSTLKNWLEERRLSVEPRLLLMKEGCIKEGCSLTVMGTLDRKNGALMIVPPPEPISTGCISHKFLLPMDVDGLVLRLPYRTNAPIFNTS